MSALSTYQSSDIQRADRTPACPGAHRQHFPVPLQGGISRSAAVSRRTNVFRLCLARLCPSRLLEWAQSTAVWFHSMATVVLEWSRGPTYPRSTPVKWEWKQRLSCSLWNSCLKWPSEKKNCLWPGALDRAAPAQPRLLWSSPLWPSPTTAIKGGLQILRHCPIKEKGAFLLGTG